MTHVTDGVTDDIVRIQGTTMTWFNTKFSSQKKAYILYMYKLSYMQYILYISYMHIIYLIYCIYVETKVSGI